MDNAHLLPPAGHRSRQIALLILALAPIAFGLLALALGQDANWDLRNYHWYNAYAFLNNRHGIDFLPSQTPWFYNPTLDVPFFLLATHAPARLAGFALGFVQGLNFILLFMLAHASLTIASHMLRVWICAALALLGMLGGGGIALIGTTFYDNVTSLGIFTSALLIIHYRDRLMQASWLHAFLLAFLFGVPSGLMMGLKLPCVIFCVGLCFGILFMGGSLIRLFTISFAFGLGVLIGIAITLGHWSFFLNTYFGSPLFPYFNDFFKSPFAPSTSARDVQFLPHDIFAYLLFPFQFAGNPYLVGEIEWRDWRIPMLYCLLPIAIVLRLAFRPKRKFAREQTIAAPYATRFLLAAAAISYIIWLWMFAIYRYAIPLEMLAPLLIVLAVGLVPFKMPARVGLAAVLLLVVAVSVMPGTWGRREAWLDRFVEAEVPPLPDHENLMILMAGFEPYSHVITEFPHDIPFVRIQSNFSSPDQQKGINRIIRQRIYAHQGPFMLLIPPWQTNMAVEALSYFSLSLAHEPCQTVIDRLYGDKALSLCKVIRNEKK